MTDQLSNDLASLRITPDTNPENGKRWWVVAVVAAIIGIGVAVWQLGYPLIEARLFKTDVALTEVMLISPSHGSTELTATGYVTPQIISRVVSKVAGRVARVFVKEGEQVAAGKVLLQLEDVDQRSLISASKTRILAALARAHTARANIAEVKAQLTRGEKLAAGGAASKSTVEDLRARLTALEETAKAALVDVKVAQAEAATSRLGLGNLTLKAPIGGTVITKPPEVGEPAGPTASTLEIADFSSLQLEADVPEARLHLVKIGGPAEISLDAFPSKRYRAQVASMGNRVNRQKASVTVKVKFLDPTDGALPDMAGRVSLLSRELDPAAMKEPPKIVLPESAVTERGGGKVVFVAESSGNVRMVPVTLGDKTQGGFELKQGPAPGTRVVKDPPSTLADGRPVREKKD